MLLLSRLMQIPMYRPIMAIMVAGAARSEPLPSPLMGAQLPLSIRYGIIPVQLHGTL